MSKSSLLLVLWLAIAACAGAFLWLAQPEGLLRWLLLFMFVPPAYLLFGAGGELLGLAYSRLPGIRHGTEFVEQRTQRLSISRLRILWYFISTLVAIALVVIATWVVRTHF